jgi:dihydrodiol dehydrogenase / D-xylose 1-dehydrogenase (NADP)
MVCKHLTSCRLKELGGGTILDLGVYVLQLAQFVFGPSPPEHVLAQGELNENGVDISTSITLKYKGGKTATLCTHARVKLPNEAYIVGTKGTIKVSGV